MLILNPHMQAQFIEQLPVSITEPLGRALYNLMIAVYTASNNHDEAVKTIDNVLNAVRASIPSNEDPNESNQPA